MFATLRKLTLFAGAIACLFTVSVQAAVIFDDDFSDGDRAKTGALDTNWWTSSSSAADEIDAGPTLGLVTGSSGRGLHTVFPTQTLVNDGTSIKATFTFDTPATVANPGSGGAMRFGLFDTLGRAALDADVDSSSGTPNAVYGWSVGNGGPGDVGLPGFFMDYDVNDGTDDLNFREHNTGSATGRLMQTTGSGSFSSFSSGPNGETSFAPNSTYTGSVSVTRVNAGELTLSGTLDGPGVSTSYSVSDTTVDSLSFGFLGFHVNGDQFGSVNTAGTPDNGINFSRITLEFIPEPATGLLLLLGGMLMWLPRRSVRR